MSGQKNNQLLQKPGIYMTWMDLLFNHKWINIQQLTICRSKLLCQFPAGDEAFAEMPIKFTVSCASLLVMGELYEIFAGKYAPLKHIQLNNGMLSHLGGLKGGCWEQ